MAIGDVEQLKLLQTTLTTTNTASQVTNSGATYKTTITSITLSLRNGSTTARRVLGYIFGSAAANEFLSLDVDPSGPRTVVLNQLDFVLSDSEIMCFKQDTGNDVNILIMGIKEQIS